MPREVKAVETLSTLLKNGSLLIDAGTLKLKIGVAVPLQDEAGNNVDAAGTALPADAAPVLVDDFALLPVAELVGLTEFAVKEFVRKNDADAAKKHDYAKKVEALKKAGLSLAEIGELFNSVPTEPPAVVPPVGSTPAGTEQANTENRTDADTAQQPKTPEPNTPTEGQGEPAKGKKK